MIRRLNEELFVASYQSKSDFFSIYVHSESNAKSPSIHFIYKNNYEAVLEIKSLIKLYKGELSIVPILQLKRAKKKYRGITELPSAHVKILLNILKDRNKNNTNMQLIISGWNYENRDKKIEELNYA